MFVQDGQTGTLPVTKPETNSQPTSNQLIKLGATFPASSSLSISKPKTATQHNLNQLSDAASSFHASSFTGFAMPPVAPRVMLPQGAGFSSFSSGPSPWISQENKQNSPWISQDGSEKEVKIHADKPLLSTGQDLQGQCARLAASMSVEKTVERKPVPEFRGYDDADYASPKDGEVRSHDDASMSHHSDRDGRLSPVDFSGLVVHRGSQLGEIDIRGLSPKLVLFYFGVLSLQETQLDPVVEYTQEAADGRWSAKLTMYRDSLKIPALESLTAAKVEICRVALSILKVRYANWEVPDEPSEQLTAFSWRWGDLLQGYSRDMKLPSPELTKYVHKNGFRYQVDVGIVTSLGHRKFYETEDQAIEAASHEVLYLLVIQELEELSEATIAASRPEHEVMSSQLHAPTTDDLSPTKIEYSSVSNRGDPSRGMSKSINDRILKPIHSANAPHRVAKATHPKSKRSNAGVASEPSISKLSNLVPVTNPRISIDNVRDEPQPNRKWKASPDQLTNSIARLQTNRQKYERVCSLLGLTSKIEFHENVRQAPAPSTYTVWATFQNEPFLTRAGPIGLINKYPGTRAIAEERCCQKVVDYLLKMVQEDYQFENEEREQRWKIDNYGALQKKAMGMDIDSTG